MKSPTRIADTHTHLHNVGDIPIEGILMTHQRLSEPMAEFIGHLLKSAANNPETIDLEPLHEDFLPEPTMATAGPPPDPFALLRWLRELTLPHQTLLDFYRKHVVSADEIICHLVDLEGFYPGTPARDRDQRHRDLATLLRDNPSVYGFVGYNPLDPDSVERLRALREEFGARMGVKFYPPSGYRPIGNNSTSVPPGQDPTTVDARNLALFEWCAKNEVRVFAHCSREGMNSHRDFASNSDPIHWRNLFDQRPDLMTMSLGLGHAGGASDWVNWNHPTDLAREALRLAQDFPRVFLDFGHFIEIVEGDWTLQMFAASFAWALREFPQATGKAMFGTDWHVANALFEGYGYVEAFLEAFSGLEPAIVDRFFWRASQDYLHG